MPTRPAAAWLLVLTAACAPAAAPVGAEPIASAPERAAPPADAAPSPSAPASGPPPLSSPAPDLPSPSGLTEPGALACTRPRCATADAVVAGTESAGPAALRVVTFTKGSTLLLPKHRGVDAVVLGLEGALFARDDAGAEASTSLSIGPWKAVRFPGAGLELEARGGDARALVAISSAPEPLLVTLAKPAAWSDRADAVEVVDLARAPDLTWPGMRARLGFERGRLGLGLLFVHPEQGVAEHDHPDSWEYLVPIAGAKTMRVAIEPGRPATEESVASRGRVVAIPKATKHRADGAAASGDAAARDVFVGLQLYAPPGPEQRFRKLADAAARP